MSAGRRGRADGLVSALFPRLVPPPPPPETEMAELLPADDLDRWALEHELAHDGHECEDLLLCDRMQVSRAVYCAQCEVLVSEREGALADDPRLAGEGPRLVGEDRLFIGEREWTLASLTGPPPEPTHAETAALVFTANAGVGALLALVAWLVSLGFTSSDLALLIAAGAVAVYGALARRPAPEGAERD